MWQDERVVGVILAGGRSSRMGRDKATLEVAERPMVLWVADALGAVCEDLVVTGRVSPIGGLETIPDVGGKYRGPLAGLAAAMRARPGETVALVAVDQPWLRAETVRCLMERADRLPVAPVDGGVRQTTCAVYPASVEEAASAELAGGGSLQSLLDVVAFDPVVDWRTWNEDGRSWFSVDTPGDVTAGLERFGRPG